MDAIARVVWFVLAVLGVLWLVGFNNPFIH